MVLKRYEVNVVESGDSFRSFSMSQINRWCGRYLHHVLNQDKPWEPHFKIRTETLVCGSKNMKLEGCYANH